MIKRVLIAMLSAAMVIAAVPTVAMAATTENYEDNGSYKGEDGNPTQNNPAAGIKEIDVIAQTAGEEITYKVILQWGAMKFKYSYGKTWNTTSHTYGATSSATGWDTSLVNETNNKINIANHSNYPVDITCEYEDGNKFGSSSNVQGVFDEDNDKLKTAISTGSHARADQPYECTLEMDSSSLTRGVDQYYWSQRDGGATEKTFYFAFIGAPQSGTVLAANTVVGKIKVTIKPAASVTLETKS